MAIARDLTGMKFHRLLVLNRVYDEKSNTRWFCLCDCGKTTIAVSQNLLREKHKSCGCWRGGKNSQFYKEKIITDGYIFIKDKDHPRANPRSGRVREHIVVMEKKIGRRLLKGEEVHHLNGVRSDNRPENLELWTKSQPSGSRCEDKVKWAVEILQTYRPELLKNVRT